MFETQPPASCWGKWLAIVALPLLFVAALAAGYTGVIPLHIEVHTLGIVGVIFIVFVAFARHNAYYAACRIKGGFGEMESALQEALQAHALTIMGETKSTLSIRDFMEDYYRHIRNDQYARVAPSVFPMLGILGTFLAIALSMPDFQAGDITALNREISVLLSGIGTAFYASIYGIGLSLVWIFFEKRGVSQAERLAFDLERLYGKRIWSRSELIKHEHMQNALRDQEIVKTLREIFNIDFIRDMNEQYMTHITALVGETTEQFKQTSAHIHTASKALRETLERLEGAKSSVDGIALMHANIEAFNQTARKMEALTHAMQTHLEKSFEHFDEELAHSIEKIGLMGRLLGEQNRQLLEVLKRLRHERQSDV